MSDLMLDVDQAGELKAAFRRSGWSNAEIKKLSEGDFLKHVREVLLGRAEIKPVEHVIDCDADPFCPEGWAVEEHRKGGKVRWDPTKVRLYLSSSQQDGKVVGGNKLRKELASKPVLNACVLDRLLDHPELIPQEWKTKLVFFWGTIYRDSGGYLCVRYLSWAGGRWNWDYYWLAYDFCDDNPAACSQVS